MYCSKLTFVMLQQPAFNITWWFSLINKTEQLNKQCKKEGLVTWAVAIHMHGLSHGCSCVLSVPQQGLRRSCNCHASSPDYHAAGQLRQNTKRGQLLMVRCKESHADVIMSTWNITNIHIMNFERHEKHFCWQTWFFSGKHKRQFKRGTVKKKKKKHMKKSRRGICQTCTSCSDTQKFFWGLMQSTFTPGVFSFDISEHKRSCVHWPGHHQWIHYEAEQKSYSALKERSQPEGKKLPPQRGLVCKWPTGGVKM